MVTVLCTFRTVHQKMYRLGNRLYDIGYLCIESIKQVLLKKYNVVETGRLRSGSAKCNSVALDEPEIQKF